jgi:hypothetical protein
MDSSERNRFERSDSNGDSGNILGSVEDEGEGEESAELFISGAWSVVAVEVAVAAVAMAAAISTMLKIA